MRTPNSYIFLLLILFSTTLHGQDFKPTLKTIDSIYRYGINQEAKNVLFQKTNQLEHQNEVNALLLARHYNLLGEIYHDASDIGKAYEYWIKSFNLIRKNYGSNSIYLAENYCLLARYHNFRINIDSAFYYAQKSLIICNSKRDSLKYVPVHKIYREYGYACKIYRAKENHLKSRALARSYFDSANYFNQLYSHDALYDAQIFQDIGNTYTDNGLYFHYDLKNQKEAIDCFQKANNNYNKALSIRINAWGDKHEKIASLYFVKGLAYDYCFGNDSIIKSLQYHQKALCALSAQYSDTSFLSIPKSNYHFSNPVDALILLRNKIGRLYYLYQKTNDINYLKLCYHHSIVAVELWGTTFKNLKSNEIHQALEVYGASPFGSIIPFANEYYQLTNNAAVKQNVFTWMDLNKYSVLLKVQLENKLISFQSGNTTISEIQNRLTESEAIIEYYLNCEELTCAVISKKKFVLFPFNKTFKINNKIDSLLLNLEKHNAVGYCETAKQLYDTILKPYIKDLPKEINHLIIIPHGKLAQIPFDALVLNQAGNYTKADFLIKYFSISYALSCNLLYSNKENDLLNNSISTIAPTYKLQTNLPFSKKVVDELRNNFMVSDFVLSDSTSSNSILHIAAHACCNYQNSRNSYVLLSDKQKLFLHEISNVRLNYKLALLNACETANGDIETGEGVINFSRHLYLAGIKSTITTLWKVDDEATANTIEAFYNELRNGTGTIASLHNAKLNYLNNSKSIDDYDPYYWAGLIYTGNDLTIQGNKNNTVLYSLIGIAAAISLVSLFRKFRS